MTDAIKSLRERASAATVKGERFVDESCCELCGSSVHLHEDVTSDDWDADPTCDQCLASFGRKARTDVPVLCDVIEGLLEHLKYIAKFPGSPALWRDATPNAITSAEAKLAGLVASGDETARSASGPKELVK